MTLDAINENILIFDREIGGFDILEAFRLAKMVCQITPYGWYTYEN